MVTTLNITLDDAVAEEAREVKDAHGLTWAEYIEEAADALTERPEQSTDVFRETTNEHAPRRTERDRPRVRDLDVPGSGEKAENRRAAIGEMYDHLKDNGTATKTDLLELVDADRVSYASPESFWSNCVKGKDTLRALPGVEPPSEGMGTWRYTASER